MYQKEISVFLFLLEKGNYEDLVLAGIQSFCHSDVRKNPVSLFSYPGLFMSQDDGVKGTEREIMRVC